MKDKKKIGYTQILKKKRLIILIAIIVIGIIIGVIFLINRDYNKFKNELISNLEQYDVSGIKLDMYKPKTTSSGYDNKYGYELVIRGNSDIITEKQIYDYIKYIESNEYSENNSHQYYTVDLIVYINKIRYEKPICGYDCLQVNNDYILNIATGEKKEITTKDNSNTNTNTNKYNKPSDVDSWGMAQEICKSYLKSPSSLKFGSLSSSTIKSLGNDKYSVSGTLEAQNSFGVMLKQNFFATFTFTGKGYSNGYCAIQ